MLEKISAVMLFSRLIVGALLEWLDKQESEGCKQCGDVVVRIGKAKPSRSKAARRKKAVVVALKILAAVLGASQGRLAPTSTGPISGK